MTSDREQPRELTYPFPDTPFTWGKGGEINRQIVMKMADDHGRLENEYGAKMQVGADINFTMRPFLDSEETFAKERSDFVENTRQEYVAWLESKRSTESNDDAFKDLVRRAKEFTLYECLMAKLYLEFPDALEFCFPHLSPPTRPGWIDLEYDPVMSALQTGEAALMSYYFVTQALPGLLHDEGTHQRAIKEFNDGNIPEFQVKPAHPVTATASVHAILQRAKELAHSLGYEATPATQHYHVSVMRENQNLTESNSETSRAILASVTHMADQLLPLLYPNRKSNPGLFWEIDSHRKWAGNSEHPLTLQQVRATKNKVVQAYQATVRQLDDRFEFRAAHADPPHMALNLSLITASVLKAMDELKAGRHPPTFTIDDSNGEQVLIRGKNKWCFDDPNQLAEHFAACSGKTTLATLQGDRLAEQIIDAFHIFHPPGSRPSRPM